LTIEQKFKQVLFPLIGTGVNHLPVDEVAIGMLRAIDKVTRVKNSTSLEEITIVDRDLAKIKEVSKVAQRFQLSASVKSSKGINYRELEKLLKAKQWDKADRQTNGLILKLANQEKNPWLKVEDVKGLSIKDLLTIDRLWVHYSDGLYGFSVQKQIYVECGGKLDFSLPSDETWNKFCDLIGWPTLGNLMTMRDFYAIKKSGSLPLSFVKIEGGHKARAYFFSLIETAKV
jgi:hypothetical protein